MTTFKLRVLRFLVACRREVLLCIAAVDNLGHPCLADIEEEQENEERFSASLRQRLGL